MTTMNSIKTGDLVKQCVFVRDETTSDALWRYGVVVGEFDMQYPPDLEKILMYKVCWSASPDFPVAGSAYTCYANGKQLEVVS